MPAAKGTIQPQESLGGRALAAIGKAIRRTTEAGKALPLPGEGDERPFRNWLRSNLLERVLGWPEDKVRAGEGFDIILMDERDRAVVTIETKAPYHRSTEKERADFRSRLQKLPHLRAAYFTNGPEWDRLDLFARDGVQEIRTEVPIDIAECTAEELEAFLTPLRGDRYFQWGRRNRSLVSRTQPHILEQLARDFDEIVADIADVLRGVFRSYDMGQAGPRVRQVTHEIFDDWCDRSLQPPAGKVIASIRDELAKRKPDRASVTALLRDQGFTPQLADDSADALLSLAAEERGAPQSLRVALGHAYADSVSKLCAQSAHLILARCLVYRVGEDVDLFDQLLGGDALESVIAPRKGRLVGERLPALVLLETVRRRMEDVLPVVYKLSDLDWWMVPPEKHAELRDSERSVVDDAEHDLDSALSRSLRRLDDFHFASVDADVWRNVYQNYLPEEERQRLGGFYTPEVLVEFILDCAGYVPDVIGLCEKTVIDPACGSGAFVNLAAARLLSHLSKPLKCHSAPPGRRPEWQRSQATLNTVASNMHGVDVHPFAAFLTTLNMTFLLLPLYASVRRHNPSYSLQPADLLCRLSREI